MKSLDCLTIVHPHAAGLNIGSREIWTAIRPDHDGETVRRFATFIPDLEASPIGCSPAAWIRWQWSPPASTGSPSSSCSKRAASTATTWSTPVSQARPRTQIGCPGLSVAAEAPLLGAALRLLPPRRRDALPAHATAPISTDPLSLLPISQLQPHSLPTATPRIPSPAAADHPAPQRTLPFRPHHPSAALSPCAPTPTSDFTRCGRSPPQPTPPAPR